MKRAEKRIAKLSQKRIFYSAATMALAASASLQATERPPNVLFIFLDDLTHDAIGALGDRGVLTPNIDALVKSGTSFTSAYMMGGWHGAYSVASRSQLLTGRYMWHSLEQEGQEYKADISSESTWPQMMRNAGYKTFMTGKWHVAHVSPQSVFDEVDTPRKGGMPSTVKESYNRPIEGEKDNWSPYDQTIGGFWEGGKHWSEVQADVTIDFIERSQDMEQPFFVYCAFNAPHDPRQAPKEYLDLYPLENVGVPENFLPEHPIYREMGSIPEGRDEALAPYPRTEFAVKTHQREYYAIISHADAQIGRIIAALKESGKYENTIIVFTADNGLAVGQHGFIGKQSLYDHSVRIPLVVTGGGAPANQKREELIYLHDIVPTIYDMVGIDTPAQVEFQSQKELIFNKRAKGRDAVYGAFQKSQRMVRMGRYKMLLVPEAKYVYLFDLEKDPAETVNLYGKKGYEKITSELIERFCQLAAESGDSFDLSTIFPELFATR